MNPATLEAAQRHAASEYPREACGLVVHGAGGEQYVPCRNVARSAAEHFVLPREDYVRAEDQGEVLALVHSHPNAPATPSDADRVGCEASGLVWHILSVGCVDGVPTCGTSETIQPAGYQAPLVGRQFAHGVLDCYTLVQDFYRRELGVTLRDYEREDDWWHKGQDLYSLDRLRAEGFDLFEGPLRHGDLILMQIRCRDVPNHAGIYLGDVPLAEAGHLHPIPTAMLHHLYGRLSERVPYGGAWAHATRYIVRHRSQT